MKRIEDDDEEYEQKGILTCDALSETFPLSSCWLTRSVSYMMLPGLGLGGALTTIQLLYKRQPLMNFHTTTKQFKCSFVNQRLLQLHTYRLYQLCRLCYIKNI